jgi:hypothetical protein
MRASLLARSGVHIDPLFPFSFERGLSAIDFLVPKCWYGDAARRTQEKLRESPRR